MKSSCSVTHLLSRCHSVRRQTGHHRLVPGRWQSQGGSAHLTYGSLKPACERCSPFPLACRDPQQGHDFNATLSSKDILTFHVNTRAECALIFLNCQRLLTVKANIN